MLSRWRAPAARWAAVVPGLVLVVAALDVLAGLLLDSGYPSWTPPVRERPAHASPGAYAVYADRELGCRTLTLAVDGTELRAHYDLYLPARHPLVERVRRGEAESDVAAFVATQLGTVQGTLPSWPDPGHDSQRYTWNLAFHPPAIQPMAAGDCPAKYGVDLAHVHVPAHPTALAFDRDRLVVSTAEDGGPTRDRVVVSGVDVLFTDGERARTDHAGRVELDRGGDPLVLLLRDRGGAFAVADLAQTRLTVADELLGGLASGAPLAVLWWYLRTVRRERPPAGIDRLCRLAGAGFGLYVVSGAAAVLLTITDWYGLWRSGAIAAWSPAGPDGDWWAPDNGTSAIVLAAVAVLVGWPVALFVGGGRVVPGRRRHLYLLAAPAAAGVSIAAVALAAGVPDPPARVVVAGLGLAIFAGFRLLAAPVLRGATGHAVAGAATVAAVVLMLGELYAEPYGYASRVSEWAYFGLYLVVVGALLVAVVRLRLSGFRHAVVVAVAAAVGVWAAADALHTLLTPAPGFAYTVWSLLAEVDLVQSLVYWASLLALLAVLRALPLADHRLMRRAGLCFAVLTFYWTSEQLFYLPVSVAVGAAMTWWVLLPARPPDDDHLVLRAARIAVRLATFDRAAERARAEVVTDLRGAAGAANVDVVQRMKDYRELEAAVPVTPAGLTTRVPEGATAEGMRDTLSIGGWRHGWAAAGYGLLLGSPWIALDSWETASGWRTGGFHLVDLVGTTSWVVLQWPIMGFFFGYFYPYIRGRNGIFKGLAYLVTLVVPLLAYRAVLDQSDLWVNLLRWTLELTLFTLLLGLVAGDVLILKRLGLGWGHLLELHRKRVVLAGLSALVAAQAAVVAAVIAGVLPLALQEAGLGPDDTRPGTVTQGTGP
ncbi:hypothetical protein [Phytohabitans houttuyneae]|uniref:hypothetical protein n=1 Tax=Phytohabitans houttuyneae TaxID=1076126 RepID=UPI00156677A7|nr:hypothetical protein [Phytohabitans houttuyneae]